MPEDSSKQTVQNAPDAADTGEAPNRGNAALGEIAPTLGLLSALALFLTAVSSWAFARGLTAALGFPGEVVNLRNSIDIFPAVGYAYAGAFLIALSLGFAIPLGQRRSYRWYWALYAFVAFSALALVLVSSLWEVHSEHYTGLLLVGSLIAPYWVGYFFQAYEPLPRAERLRQVTGMLLLAFLLNATNLYVFGVSTGVGLTSGKPTSAQTERGLSALKPNDFPLVSISTIEDVPAPCAKGTAARTHVQADKVSLRLILSDDSNYYLICRTSSSFAAFALRKELVREMEFQGHWRRH